MFQYVDDCLRTQIQVTEGASEDLIRKMEKQTCKNQREPLQKRKNQKSMEGKPGRGHKENMRQRGIMRK